MKLLILSCFVSCTLVSSLAQNLNYEFNEFYTQTVISETGKVPYMYSVKKENVTFEKKVKLKRESPQYLAALDKLNSFVKDSTSISESYSKELDKFTQLNKVKTLINDFLNSTKPYELKKGKLIEAQKIADTHHKDLLIYADNNINTKNKSNFFVLQLKSLDLKIHLKKVIWKVDASNKKPENSNNEDFKNIEKHRNNLKSIKKFEYYYGPSKKSTRNALVLNEKIEKLTTIKGEFKVVNDYVYLKNKTKWHIANELILYSEIKESAKKDIFSPLKKLIENVNSKELFLVDLDFLETYAINPNKKEKFITQNEIETIEIDKSDQIFRSMKSKKRALGE
ncbi:hypothetical protein [Aquimarina agarilytica]|uniref:hypothetical protein n=1 Tax=Aquimarina agarilytica TaxID=1087449 RepID=UPI0004928983|nr:hypothetical protein [Aquimarina agarilytica]